MDQTSAEARTCQNCKQEFRIEPEDFNFYAKINVPPPTWCPECRYIRRLSHRNERTFFKRKCNATGADIISIYPPDTSFPVYEQKHWDSSEWDALQYGIEFDFNKPFFEQFRSLQARVPRPSLRDFESINSFYCNQCERNKDAYMVVSSSHNRNAMYSFWAQTCEDVADVTYYLESRESYDSVGAAKGQRIFWSQDIENSFDCWFSFDLKGCNNCFLSSNLRNKSYYWENRPLSKEEWLLRFAGLNTGNYSATSKLKDSWLEMIGHRAIHKFAEHHSVSDVSGNCMYESKNVHASYDVTRCENCKYSQDIMDVNDSFDNTETAFKFENTYEVHGSAVVSHSAFVNICWESHHLRYSDLCRYSSNLFGCIGLSHKSYCILNKQYTKDEYETLVPKIIAHMRATGEWGEFFPPQLSVFSYNETAAQTYFPIQKETAISRGWRWNDNIPGTRGKETIKPDQIPDSIKDVGDSMLNDILACRSCEKNYRLIPQELEFYRKMNLPIPRLCPMCRFLARLALRVPKKMWSRQCMCDRDRHTHEGRCSMKFETGYAPDRSELVYCESCYNAEVV